MTEYLTHDLTLNLGEEVPEDLTLNMLRFPARDTTLVVARSPVANDKSLDEAIDDQLRMLRKKSRAMTITPTRITRLGSDEDPIEGREMAIEFRVGDKPNFQLQAACLIPGQHRLLGSVRKVLWERACPAMECEALPYPISTSVKVAVNSGFAAALRQIAGQARSHNDG